jgi:hypothetical protein
VGGVEYEHETIEAPHKDDDGQEVSAWKGRRTVEDPEEFARAKQARSMARGQVVNVCAATSFGLLCPLDREERLYEGVAEMHRIADKFNAGSKFTSVECRIIIGRVEQDDAEAVRSIETETAKLVQGMEKSILSKDPVAIGKFCDQARDLSVMLEDESKLVIKEAIVAARVAKRQMTKLLKSGEAAKIVVDQKLIAQLAAVRTSFLDIDSESEEVQAPDVAEAPAVEMDDDDTDTGVYDEIYEGSGISAASIQMEAQEAPQAELD